MIINGIDTSKLVGHEVGVPFPAEVRGRVCQIDGDFLAYQVSTAPDVSLWDMYSNCESMIEKIRKRAAAETAIVYLTPRGSNKGRRYEVAMLKEYQANRVAKPKPEFLHVIREWMHKELGATLCTDCEADDGMSMAQYTAIKQGKQNLSIIATRDKDLRMVPGLALDWVSHVITDTGKDPFGYIELVQNNSGVKKITGRGSKFFWAQLLMGDAADNISGLPKICDPQYLKGKPVRCGAVGAFNILQDKKNDLECFTTVLSLFRMACEHEQFVNWRNQEPISAEEGFSSEACLLWMRRENNANDFLDWMKENCK